MGRRRINRQLIIPRITIIGEGLTERRYFEHLRRIKGFRYDCKPRFFAHQSYAEMRALIERVLEDGGIAVCVCDADITRRNDVEKKLLHDLKETYAHSDRVYIFDSMPSIEFWFLLHFVKTNKFFSDSKAVINDLLRFIPGYEKSDSFLANAQWVRRLCEHQGLETACHNAAQIGREGESYSRIDDAIRLFVESK